MSHSSEQRDRDRLPLTLPRLDTLTVALISRTFATVSLTFLDEASQL